MSEDLSNSKVEEKTENKDEKKEDEENKPKEKRKDKKDGPFSDRTQADPTSETQRDGLWVYTTIGVSLLCIALVVTVHSLNQQLEGISKKHKLTVQGLEADLSRATAQSELALNDKSKNSMRVKELTDELTAVKEHGEKVKTNLIKAHRDARNKTLQLEKNIIQVEKLEAEVMEKKKELIINKKSRDKERSQLQEQNKKLQASIEDLTQKNEELNNIIRRENIDKLKQDESLEEELTTLKSELKIKETLADNLQNALSICDTSKNKFKLQTDDKISELESALKDSEKKYQVETEALNNKIKMMQHNLDQNNKKLDFSKKEYTTNAKLMEELKGALQKALTQLQEDKVKLEDQEKIIATLREKRQELAMTVDMRSTESQKKTEIIEHQKKQLEELQLSKAEMENNLKKNKDALTLAQEEAAMFKQKAADVKDELIVTHIELSNMILKDQTIEQLKKEINEKDKSILDLQSSYMETKNSIEILKQSLNNAEGKVAEADKHVTELQQQVNVATHQLREVQENAAIATQQSRELQENAAVASQQLEELKEHAALADNALQEKQNVIENLQDRIKELEIIPDKQD